MPLAVLHETGQLRTKLGRQVMLYASVGEFFSIIALTGYELSVRFGMSLHLVGELVKLAGLFLISSLIIRWSQRAAVWWPSRTVPPHGRGPGRRRDGHARRAAAHVRLRGPHRPSRRRSDPRRVHRGRAHLAFVLKGEGGPRESKVAALGNGLFIPIFFTVVGVRFKAIRRCRRTPSVTRSSSSRCAGPSSWSRRCSSAVAPCGCGSGSGPRTSCRLR